MGNPMKPKFTALFAAMVAVLFTTTPTAASSSDLSNTRIIMEKPSGPAAEENPLKAPQPGDTIEDPFLISELPFADSGETCSFNDDYDEECPYAGSTSPDVVYAFTPAYDLVAYLTLCGAPYDTKLYVYENRYTPGAPYACNDDECMYQSEIPILNMWGGITYYIVVDGYGGECGEYNLQIDEMACKSDYCPPGTIDENEPVCQDDYDDSHNGGCGSIPPAFQTLEPTGGVLEVCGQSGTFLTGGADTRDTDWYEINPSETTYLTFCGDAWYPLSIAVIDANGGCGNHFIRKQAEADFCAAACISDTLQPGRYWLWVAPNIWNGVECGSEYLLYIGGYLNSTATSIGDVADPPPQVPLLEPNRPNPLSAATAISFDLPETVRVKLLIFDISGRRVNKLIDRMHSPGQYKVTWGANDDRGRRVAPGVYFARLEAGEFVATQRLVVVK